MIRGWYRPRCRIQRKTFIYYGPIDLSLFTNGLEISMETSKDTITMHERENTVPDITVATHAAHEQLSIDSTLGEDMKRGIVMARYRRY